MVETHVPVIIGTLPESLIGSLVEATPELTPRPKIDLRRRIEPTRVDTADRFLEDLVAKGEPFLYTRDG